MNIINLRKELRRKNESRRMGDRRLVSYEFGSAEWLEHVQKSYAAYPRAERRAVGRRANERRTPDRRQYLEEQRRAERNQAEILLTREELKLIEDLYLSDI